MRSMISRFRTGALAFAALAGLPAAAFGQDKIHLKNNPVPHEGVVITMTCREIQYESALAAGVTQTQAASDVRAIEFDPMKKPTNMDLGESSLRKGDFADAKAKFEAGLRDPRIKEPQKQQSRWYLLRCLVNLGEWDGALAAARQLREEFPEGFYLKDSFLLQYQAAMGKGSLPDLESAVTDFNKTAGARGLAKEWEKNIDLLRAELMELKRDFRTAKTLHEKYLRNADAEVALEARLGQLRCLAGLQDWSGLKGAADGIISDAKGKAGLSVRLTIGAYLSRGRALLLGDGKSKDALLDFMRCVVELGPKLAEGCREHEESLAMAAIASARLAGEQTDKEKRATYRSRAEGLKGELLKYYRGSSHAGAVEQAIAAIATK